MKRIRRFLAEAISELRKVSWPTFAQTRNLTVLVFAVSFVVGVFVAVVDAVFQGVIGFIANLA
ncbi:MAG: preprotein translocase subunit SecE [Gemmatimonadetes bacterium]|nr:preprotein translocase subunit SecE [Gemmatimonadota bacterium]